MKSVVFRGWCSEGGVVGVLVYTKALFYLRACTLAWRPWDHVALGRLSLSAMTHGPMAATRLSSRLWPLHLMPMIAQEVCEEGDGLPKPRTQDQPLSRDQTRRERVICYSMQGPLHHVEHGLFMRPRLKRGAWCMSPCARCGGCGPHPDARTHVCEAVRI